MRLVLVTGGVRSGKSSYAQQRAHQLGGDDVTFVATATRSDGEMADRIRRHQAERPSSWELVESPTLAGRAVLSAKHDVVLVDCLTLLAANALGRTGKASLESVDHAVTEEATALVLAARSRAGCLIIVTNEVGSGIHPPSALGRWYQDALGRANQLVARAADEVVLTVCGIGIVILPSSR
jgi:adenosyl cobinamide kinase/adenosyl cobinamide phosphate guanylyltransferase